MSRKAQSGLRLSRRRRAVFLSIIAISVYGTTELMAIVVRYIINADHYDHNIEDIAQTATADGGSDAIHPYLGWVRNPQASRKEKLFGKEIPVNQLGFLDTGPSIRKRSPDRYIIAIVGGSVAWHVSVAGADTIKERLKSHPALQGREIEIVRLASPGYKQPQQVMALNYVQVLGGQFDAVINIDGYNEAALALVDNGYSRTAVAYPRSWARRTISSLDPKSYASAARLLELRGRRQQAARHLRDSPFRWSPLRRLFWCATDQFRQTEMMQLAKEVSSDRNESFVNHGPFDQNATKAELKSSVIDLWKQSSVQLQRLCSVSKTVYLHVLQPNQYMTGSKTLSTHELEHAYSDTQELGIAIKELYPRLIAEADWLREAGVNFSDQTMLFVDETDTIYSDPFCHYNQRGNEILAMAVAEQLAQMPLKIELKSK